ncbi:MAG: hypothetical protein AAFV59_12875 [Pseudomonadota bacterium]
MSKSSILSDIAFICQRPIGDQEKLFEERSRSILSSVSAFLNSEVRTEGIWKISLCVNSQNPRQHMKIVEGVFRYNTEVDIGEFLSLPISEQRIEMLGIVDRNLREVFEALHLDSSRLDGLSQFVADRDFTSTFSGPVSKKFGMSAKVLSEQRFEQANIYVSIVKNGAEVKRVFVMETSPEEFQFNMYLKAPKWVSENEILLTASNGETHSVLV